MLADVGYSDMGGVAEITNGVELTGDIPVTSTFEPSFKCAELTVAELRLRSVADTLSAYYSARSSGDPEIDETVFEKTRDGVKQGWAIGPFDFSKLPKDAAL